MPKRKEITLVYMKAGTIKGLLRIIPRDLADVGYQANFFGITFEPDGMAVATNGHMLLAFRTGQEFEGKPFIIQADVLRTAIKGQKAKSAIDLDPLKLADSPIATINWRRVIPAKYSGLAEENSLDPEYILAVRDALNDIFKAEELAGYASGMAIKALSPVPNGGSPWLAFAGPRALAIILPIRPGDTAKAMLGYAAKFLTSQTPDSEG